MLSVPLLQTDVAYNPNRHRHPALGRQRPLIQIEDAALHHVTGILCSKSTLPPWFMPSRVLPQASRTVVTALYSTVSCNSLLACKLSTNSFVQFSCMSEFGGAVRVRKMQTKKAV